jgi:hypothetical protein
MFVFVLFRGLTPTAMCCRRYAAEVCNFKNYASDYRFDESANRDKVVTIERAPSAHQSGKFS